MSKSSEYWKLRERENRQRLKTLKLIDSYNRQIDTIYRNMLDSVQKEIDAFYGKYASDEGITIAEAKKRVSQLDIEAYGRKAKRYVANKTFTDKANAEMKIYNLTMKVNRLELLKSNIGLELVNGFDELEKLFGEKITEEGIKEFRRQAGILGDTVVDTDKDKRYRKQADRIARASFHNATFSDRIWMHQDLLRNEIDKALQKALISGTSMERLARDIRNAFGVSTKNAQRLMRTEIRRMQTDAAMESYRRNGNEKYEYMALGQRPCDACRALEGKVFNVKDIEIGVNAPPMHPNCMCSTAPYVDEKAYQEWLDWIDAGGTTLGWNTFNVRSETEEGHKGRIKDTVISRKRINSSDYGRRLSSIDPNRDVSNLINKEGRKILKHRSGTKYEDLLIIDSNTEEYINRSDYNKINQVLPSKRQLKMIGKADKRSIIAVHNHPGSTVPSPGDIGAAKERSYKYGVVLCHNGDIYKYSIQETRLNIPAYSAAVAKLDQMGYNKTNIKSFIDEIKLLGIEMELL